jgi:diguanylate cyclase (GGDEF)-like protein
MVRRDDGPTCHPGRMRGRWRAVSSDARRAWQTLEPARLGTIAASVVLVTAGAVALAAAAAAGGDDARPERGLATIAVGLAASVVPWDRWHPRARLVLPFAVVLLVAGGVAGAGGRAAELAVLPLAFVLAGFIQPPGGAALLAVPAALVVALSGGPWAPPDVGAATAVLGVSVLTGEAIAQLVRRQAHVERRVERLVDAVRALARADDERRGAELLAVLTTQLAGADAAAVFLADPNRPKRLVQRAGYGHPALVERMALTLDAAALADAADARAGTFFHDARLAPFDLDCEGAARSVLTIPLRAARGDVLGVVVGVWVTRCRALPAPARHAARVLEQEGGRMVARLRATARLAREARTDPLTELANRRTFAHALDTLRPGDAVVVIDLDHFKAVNDRFGHAAGDEVLRALAACLRRTARQVDTVARCGGEEFALVLPDAGSRGAQAVVRRVRERWAAAGAITTFSAGIAVHDGHRPPSATLAAADAALYEAKAAGRDCTRVEAAVPSASAT